jgi:1-aminocyclopropane-1-carboxylate deaminase/D-cysteine desulfhydrase-like pyridoxal-dependent ACC family enzyme
VSAERLNAAIAARPKAALATLPTPLEEGPLLPGGARLWVKRDDLTGLGMGGNKARKLEHLCGVALAEGADTLVTVGAGQSNHCRMTAAAGARLGLDVHLVLGGTAPERPAGNQLLSALFGARAHHAGTDDWGELERAKDALAEELRASGRRPFAIPIGGSTAVGAVGFAAAFVELVEQAAGAGCRPRAVVHATSSGGTHAGLLAARAATAAAGDPDLPEVVAVAVAKGVLLEAGFAAELAGETLALLGLYDVAVDPADVHVEGSALGDDYAVPTPEADDALLWAAHHGGWVLDRVYTAKAFAGLLALAAAGRWGPGDDVVFWHTGGQPALFAPGGAPGIPGSARPASPARCGES